MIWWQRALDGSGSMISVVIPTHESERLLVPTLSALVPGALAGLVREVIVADAGSRDETAKVADVAGCNFIEAPGPLGARLAVAAASARADWLMFLHPGSVPELGWIDETERFIRASELADRSMMRAAVFRPSMRTASTIGAALALIATSLGARPKPSQGLLIAKTLYDEVKRHDTTSADPETDLLRRLGRRRIAVIRCSMAHSD